MCFYGQCAVMAPVPVLLAQIPDRIPLVDDGPYTHVVSDGVTDSKPIIWNSRVARSKFRKQRAGPTRQTLDPGPHQPPKTDAQEASFQ